MNTNILGWILQTWEVTEGTLAWLPALIELDWVTWMSMWQSPGCIIDSLPFTWLWYYATLFLMSRFSFSDQQNQSRVSTWGRPCVVIRFIWSFQSYSELYDLSRSERRKVHELAVTMATDGEPLERIRELLGVAVGPLDLSVKMVFGDAVEKVVAALRYQSSPLSYLMRQPRFLIPKWAFSETKETILCAPVFPAICTVFFDIFSSIKLLSAFELFRMCWLQQCPLDLVAFVH